MLVLDFQAGEPEAFVEIHRRYGPLARHVCLRFLPNRQDADDAFQETMIRVFQGLHRFNGRYALQPWIARIATNVSLDQIRTRTRRPLLEDGSIEDHERRDPADGPEDLLERLVQRDLVLSVMAGLPESHRTALVLRELEGRSHREIAEALEISPAQAKALIHRAKGSFRRRWLLAVTEKGGLTGVALLPLLWLARAADGLRRVVDRVGGQATQVAQVATPEVVTSAASSPAVVTAASSISERVVAAGVTLLLAGGVTVGAATIVKHKEREPVEGAVAAPTAQQSPVLVPVVPAVVEQDPRPGDQGGRVRHGSEGNPTPAVVPPVDDTGVSPTPEPTPSPTTEPSPSPEPTIPPAPPWSLAFGSSTDLGVGSFEQVSSRVTGSAGRQLIFSQAVAAPRLDVDGVEHGHVYLEYWGSAEGADGSISIWLFIDTPTGRYRFDGEGTLVSTVLDADGVTTYVFSGVYFLAEQPDAVGDASEELPPLRDGTFEIELRFWADARSLYEASVGLTETDASGQPSPSWSVPYSG
jgi:RNA polymerase sigma-70 factor (ECF subfamily)